MNRPISNEMRPSVKAASVLWIVIGLSVMTFGQADKPKKSQTPTLPTVEQVIQQLSSRFGLTEEVVSTIPFHPSAFSDYYEAAFSFGQSPHIRSQRVYISKDARYAIVGQIFNLGLDGSELQRISTKGRPEIGPTDAPLTIIEFSDYQCPVCAKMHDFLIKEVIPKYKNRIRIVFKDFPNSPDDWGLRAAVASDCVYGLKPETWSDYRSSVFAKAISMNRENARDILIELGTNVGIDKEKLSACVDSKSALLSVQDDIREGQAVNVAGTPTFFIMGDVLAGFVKPETFFRSIDGAMNRVTSEGDCHCLNPQSFAQK